MRESYPHRLAGVGCGLTLGSFPKGSVLELSNTTLEPWTRRITR